MENNLCIRCGGKGYRWQELGILQNHAGQNIASTYKHDGECGDCKGTGRATRPVTCGTIVVGFILLLAFFAFVANPLAHLISS